MTSDPPPSKNGESLGENVMKDLAQILKDVDQQDGRLFIKYSEAAGCLCFAIASKTDRNRRVYHNAPAGEPIGNSYGNGTFSLIVQGLARRYLQQPQEAATSQKAPRK